MAIAEGKAPTAVVPVRVRAPDAPIEKTESVFEREFAP